MRISHAIQRQEAIWHIVKPRNILTPLLFICLLYVFILNILLWKFSIIYKILEKSIINTKFTRNLTSSITIICILVSSLTFFFHSTLLKHTKAYSKHCNISFINISLHTAERCAPFCNITLSHYYMRIQNKINCWYYQISHQCSTVVDCLLNVF